MGVRVTNNFPTLQQTLADAIQDVFTDAASQWVQHVAQATPRDAIGRPYVESGWYLRTGRGDSTYADATARLQSVASEIRNWFHADPSSWFVSVAQWFRGTPSEWWVSPRIVSEQSQPSFPGVVIASATAWTGTNESIGVPFVRSVLPDLTIADHALADYWKRHSGV